MKHQVLVTLLGAVCLAPAAYGLQGPGLAAELPAETQAYFEISDIPALVNGAKNSALGRIYHEPEVQEFVADLLPLVETGWHQIREMAASQGVPKELIDWHALTTYEAGFCIVPNATGEPSMCGGFAVGLRGELSKQVFDLLATHMTQQGGQIEETDTGPVLYPRKYRGAESFRIYRSGNRIIGMFEYGNMPSSSLADTARFQSIRSGARKGDAQMMGYLDWSGMVDTLLSISSTNAPPEAHHAMKAMFDTMGLDSMQTLVMTSGWTKSGDSFIDVDIDFADGGPTGIFNPESRGGSPDVDLSLLDYIPDDATSFTVATMDGTGVWDIVRDAIVKAMPEREMEGWKQSGHPSYEWVLGDKSEIVSAGVKGFGARSFSYSVQGGSGGAFSEVRDVPAVRRMFTEVAPLVKMLLDEAGEIPAALDVKKLQIRERDDEGNIVTREGSDYYTIKLRPERLPREMAQLTMVLGGFQPSMGVTDDGWMVMSMSPSEVRKALRSGVQKAEENIRNNSDVASLLSALPDNTYSVAWSDPRPGLESAITQMQAMLPMAQMYIPADQLPVDLTAMPGPDVVVRNMRPTHTYSWNSADGSTHSYSEGSFNMVDVLVFGGAVVTVAAPLLMPMVMGSQAEMHHEEEWPEPHAEPAPDSRGASGGITRGNSGAKTATLRELDRLDSGILVFEIERERMPKSLSELTIPYGHYTKGFLPSPEKGIVADGFGNPFVFKTSGSGYKLYSMGPNGKDDNGSGDDILLSTN